MSECAGGRVDASWGHTHLTDQSINDMVEALVREGLPETEARKIVQVVLSHVGNDGGYPLFSVRRRPGPTASKWWTNAIGTVLAMTATFLAAFPVVRELHNNGYPVAAVLVTSALAAVAAIASWRLTRIRRPSPEITIDVRLPGRRPTPPCDPSGEGEEGVDLDPGDVGTFANAVSRVADSHRTYAIG